MGRVNRRAVRCDGMAQLTVRLSQVRKQYLEELRSYRSEMTAAIERLETHENKAELSPHDLMLAIQAVDKACASCAWPRPWANATARRLGQRCT